MGALCYVSKSDKDKYYMNTYISNQLKKKNRKEIRFVVTRRGREKGNWMKVAKGTNFQFIR